MLKNKKIEEAAANNRASAVDRDAYDRILIAGKKTILDKATFSDLSKNLEKSPDLVSEITNGIIGILAVLYKQSRKTMPIPSLMQAGMELVFYAMDMAEQAGMIKVGNEQIVKATKEYTETLMPMLGITPEMIDKYLSMLGGTIKDPAKMAQIQGGK